MQQIALKLFQGQSTSKGVFFKLMPNVKILFIKY